MWLPGRIAQPISAVARSAQRCRPVQRGASAGGVAHTESSVGGAGTMSQIGKTALGDVVRDAPAVVDNIDTQLVFDPDVDRHLSSLRMPDRVAEGFAHNGFRVIGQSGINYR
jgi:hypothetical protein